MVPVVMVVPVAAAVVVMAVQQHKVELVCLVKDMQVEIKPV